MTDRFDLASPHEALDDETDVPLDVRRELMACATKNGSISYHWLCGIYRRGVQSVAARPHEQEQVVQDTWKAQAERGVEQFQTLMTEHLALRDALTARDQQIAYLNERVEFKRYEEAEAALSEARQQLAALRQALEKIETMTASSTPGFIDMSLTVSFMRHEARDALSASRAPQGEAP